jgi:uncharacterized membrane protein (UPF0136 family)
MKRTRRKGRPNRFETGAAVVHVFAFVGGVIAFLVSNSIASSWSGVSPEGSLWIGVAGFTVVLFLGEIIAAVLIAVGRRKGN